MSPGSPRPWTAYAAFVTFGALWGVWGTSIPAIRDAAGVSEGQLGTALLFIGAGALPAMWIVGRVVDRWRHRATAALVALLGPAGLLVALTARDPATLCVGLAALGAASGAADVAINATAGSIQQAVGSPVVGRAHGAFSLAVAVSSLGAGALDRLGSPTQVAFALVAALGAAVAVSLVVAEVQQPVRAPLLRSADAASAGGAPAAPSKASEASAASLRWAPLMLLGGLGALAFAVESAFQNWSALFMRDVIAAGPTLAAAGPAVFAGVVAVTRFSASSLGARRPTAVIVAGSAVAALGSVVVAGAATVPVALLGFGLAAVGTAVLFPTLISVMNDRVSEEVRGTATSRVTGLAYMGFLLGPVYVGWWAEWTGLASAMLAVAALAATLTVLAGALVRPERP